MCQQYERESRNTLNTIAPFYQILIAVSIPTLVALVGVILNQTAIGNLSAKVDRLYENFNNQGQVSNRKKI